MINNSELMAFGKSWHLTEINTAANGDQTIYMGKTAAEHGNPHAPSWCIKRVTITKTSGKELISEQYADGDTNFDNIWQNRENLTYKYLI